MGPRKTPSHGSSPSVRADHARDEACWALSTWPSGKYSIAGVVLYFPENGTKAPGGSIFRRRGDNSGVKSPSNACQIEITTLIRVPTTSIRHLQKHRFRSDKDAQAKCIDNKSNDGQAKEGPTNCRQSHWLPPIVPCLARLDSLPFMPLALLLRERGD